MIYQIVIENWNEEFEIVDEVINVDEAIKIAKNYPIEKYKSIMVWLINKQTGEKIEDVEV